MRGALRGIRVIDLSVNAPGPFASMVLADLGARVTCIVNPTRSSPAYAGACDDPMLAARGGPHDALARGKITRALDLKTEAGRAEILGMLGDTDVLISEMRPGKLEALALGWEALSAVNPRLILCEISGYGFEGPRAPRAGHDINYLAVSGALSLFRDRDGKPLPPQNIVGDYAAGGNIAVTGILAALFKRERTGQGARIRLCMTDGVRYLMSDIAAATLLGAHSSESWRATLGGGMPTYDTYETADGEWMAVGALEPKFIRILADGLDWPELVRLMAAKATWEDAREGLESRFREKSRLAWTEIFGELDACVTPVYALDELTQLGLPTLDEVLGMRKATDDGAPPAG